MLLSSLLVAVLSLASHGVATSQWQYGACENPVIRKEWRTLSRREQADYTEAVQCLFTLPAITTATAPGAVNRYDDFHGTHINQTPYIHFVGHFLAWHRTFVATYEHHLRTECNYKGAQPYWDWTLDVESNATFLASPLFFDNAFGGNGPFVEAPATLPFTVPGRTGGGCVPNGQFQNMTVRLGPGPNVESNPRCLTRDFSFWIALNFLNQNITQRTLDQPNFGWFDQIMEGQPNFNGTGVHGGGHFGVGGSLGTMGDMYSSPGDPIFFMHHTQIDRLWWLWQKKNLPARLFDISGPVNPFNMPPGPNVTLEFNFTLGPLTPFSEIQVGDVMNIQGPGPFGFGPLCYDYD